MKTKSPYEMVSADDVSPGDLILMKVDDQVTSAFAIRFKNNDVGFLVLNGEHIGTVQYLNREGVLRFTSEVYLELPRDSGGWVGDKRPDAPLVVAIDGKNTYFVYQKYQQRVAVNIDGGNVVDIPYGAFYLSKWAIYCDQSVEPVLQGSTQG